MPPTVPINHYGGPRNQQNRTARPILLFHANVSEHKPALNSLIFSKYKSWFPDTPSEGHAVPQRERPDRTSARGEADRPARPKVQLRAFFLFFFFFLFLV